jgi:hypothetical protein
VHAPHVCLSPHTLCHLSVIPLCPGVPQAAAAEPAALLKLTSCAAAHYTPFTYALTSAVFFLLPLRRSSPSSCCSACCPQRSTSCARTPCLAQTAARAAGRVSTSCTTLCAWAATHGGSSGWSCSLTSGGRRAAGMGWLTYACSCLLVFLTRVRLWGQGRMAACGRHGIVRLRFAEHVCWEGLNFVYDHVRGGVICGGCSWSCSWTSGGRRAAGGLVHRSNVLVLDPRPGF